MHRANDRLAQPQHETRPSTAYYSFQGCSVLYALIYSLLITLSLVFPFLGFEYRVVDQFYILVIQAYIVGFGSLICKCMLEPVCVIALLVISAIMRAPAFGTCQRPMNSSLGALKQEPKLDSFDHFSVN